MTTQYATPAPTGDFADLDAQLFGADGLPATPDPAATPAQGVMATPEAQQPPSEALQVLAETVRRMEQNVNTSQRLLNQLASRGGEVPPAMQQALEGLKSELADMREQKEWEGLTLAEQNAKLREKVAAKNAPAPAPQPIAIDRTAAWFEQAVGADFRDDVTPEIQEMAEDLGITVTPAHLANLLSHAVRGENQVPVTYDDGKPFLEWDTWLRKVVRPALRQEALRQATEARANPAPQRSAARQQPAALGGGSRAAAGGTPALDFFKSNNGDEIAAANWGSLR